MKLFKKTQIDSFAKSWKDKGVQVKFFNKRQIKKHFKGKLHNLLVDLGKFISGIDFNDFNGFSIILQKKAPMSWHSNKSGRIVLNLTLFDPRNPVHKKEVQELAQKAREIESTTKELMLGKRGLF